VTGLSFYDLSRKLASVSVNLIREHPLLYARTVVKGWWLFWRAPFYWQPEAIASPGLRALFSGLVTAQRGGLVLVNMVFVIASLLVLSWKRARGAARMNPYLWFIGGLIWLSSVAQTLPDHGDNPRFLIPLQSWVVFCVLWLAWSAIQSLKRPSKR
jgi:hypothetical protein